MPQARVIKLEATQKYQRLVSKDSGTRGIKSGHVILQSGENVGEHTTGDKEEIIVVLKGRGEAAIEKDSALNVEENTVLYIPPQTTHDIKNTGPGMLEYVFITSAA